VEAGGDAGGSLKEAGDEGNERGEEGERNIDSEASLRKWGSDVKYDGEFDPGSELTLAARLKHASRTGTCPSGWGRVANG
jgi:hypothetical protein